MKNGIKHFAVIVLFPLCAIFMPSCQNDLDEINGQVLTFSNTIGESGGVLHALDGDVVLVFPVGALSEPVTFSVNTCFDAVECDFVLKPVIIEPVISFAQPVQLIIKYDGPLANGVEICENMCIMASFWDTDHNFHNNVKANSCICEIDYDAKIFSFCICQSGIFTLSIEE